MHFQWYFWALKKRNKFKKFLRNVPTSKKNLNLIFKFHQSLMEEDFHVHLAHPHLCCPLQCPFLYGNADWGDFLARKKQVRFSKDSFKCLISKNNFFLNSLNLLIACFLLVPFLFRSVWLSLI